MTQNNPSFFLLGGSFMVRLEQYLAGIGTVVGKRTGISPIARYVCSEDGTAIEKWLLALAKTLTAKKPDWLIVDLQRAEATLFAVKKQLVMVPEDGNLSRIPYQRALITDPYLLSPAVVETAIKRVASVLLKRVPPDRIILLHAHRPEFWLAGDSLRTVDSPATIYTEAQRQRLAYVEQLFRKHTGCRYVDISRFYFYRKEPGRPLTNVIFEDECYEDTARCIAALVHGAEPEQTRPDFALSLDRYVRYRHTLLTKCFSVFLDNTRLPDRLVLAGSAAFVRDCREDLLRLEELYCADPDTALQKLESAGAAEDFIRIASAFAAAAAGDYVSCPPEDYALMFRSGVVPPEVLAMLKAESAGWGLSPLQIIRANAGVYFARRMGWPEDLFRTEKTVERPPIVDVFGSCVSRTGFNIQENDAVVNRYWFHVPPLESSNPKIQYPPELFAGKLRWQDRLVKNQFDRRTYQDIRNSEGEWLVVDMYCLAAANMYIYEGLIYTDFLERVSKQLGAKKASIHRDPSLRGSMRRIMEQTEDWCRTVREKYGDRIILINALRSDYWRGDDGMIYRLPRHMDQNTITDYAYDYLGRKLDCYRINLAAQFMPDETGFMRKVPSHTEDICYQLYHDIMLRIMRERPAQKEYTRVPGAIRVEHLLRLSPDNPVSALEKFFCHHPLDPVILRMDRDMVRRYRTELAALYDTDGRTLDAVLAACPPGSEAAPLERELRRLAAETAPRQASEPEPLAYLPYRPEEGILSGRTGLSRLPGIPRVELSGVDTADGVPTVRWKWRLPSGPGQSAHLYRMKQGGIWREIAVLTDDSVPFRDESALRFTEYFYRMSGGTELEGKTYIGRLTPIVQVNTAFLGKPSLQEAEESGGSARVFWKSVPGADGYRVYRRSQPDGKWIYLSDVGGDIGSYEEPVPSREKTWVYTVRAFCVRDGKKLFGGYEPGITIGENRRGLSDRLKTIFSGKK